MRTEQGESSKILRKNAPVAMPISSTHEIAANGRERRYREGDGDIVDIKDGRVVATFISHSGVYFQKIFLPRGITKGCFKTRADADLPSFGRPEP